MKRQVQEREPHFIGISEVKNRDYQDQILAHLGLKEFGTLSVKFDGEFLVHGWHTSKYVIDAENAVGRNGPTSIRMNNGDNPPDDCYGYGHRYIWTRLKSKSNSDEGKKFILVTCHMPKQKLQGIRVDAAWEHLMAFIQDERENKGVPILLMGDTNKSWQIAIPTIHQPVRYSELQLKTGFSVPVPVPVPYPHLALIKQIGGQPQNPPTTLSGSFIDNFIFFYKDGEKHEDFTKNYCVDYHRLGWTSHHVLVFRFNRDLLVGEN